MFIPFLAVSSFIQWDVYIILKNFNGKLGSDCIDLNHSGRTVALGSNQPITEMGTISLGVKAAGV